ncbi:MAG: response regulator [Chloroflexi bacterium]|nr:response regulator [Chloroflexota bacterium]
MHSKPAHRPPANILIVDDNPANLRLLSQMLTEHGYTVRPVTDGQLALGAALVDPPDLILLDIRMPGMDGYQVCQRLKAAEQTRDIPIIFISALDATEDKVRAFSLGGVDYVTKPFHVEEVLARLETHLALRRLQLQLLDANQKMARELALAGEIQASFLPHPLPEIPGWQIAATLKPARETSGDFYDLIPLPNRRLGLVIADVSDKGVGAALYMALSRTVIRIYAADYYAEPEIALRAANIHILRDTQNDQFVTTFFGVLDPLTATLTYANAGHPPPFLIQVQEGPGIQQLPRTGMPLGISREENWQRGLVHLAPGDGLILYTDGITEATGEKEAFWGETGLMQSIQTSRGRRAQKILDAVLADVRAFVGDAPQSDDIALVVLTRNVGERA